MTVTRSLTIRTGGREDLPVVRHILTSANAPYRDALAPEAFEPYLDMVLDLEPRLAAATLIIVDLDGQPAGTVTFFPDAADEGWGCPPGFAGIRSMAVDPAAQRQGVGAALVGECRRRAVDGGAVGILLHTSHFLPAAIRLYQHHGFIRDPSQDLRAIDVMDLPDAASDFPALAFRLDLTR